MSINEQLPISEDGPVMIVGEVQPKIIDKSKPSEVFTQDLPDDELENILSEVPYTFCRCEKCGKILTPERIEKSKVDGKLCPCGCIRFSPTNVSLLRELIYLAFHPRKISLTVFNPKNWGKTFFIKLSMRLK
jgi:hypothetical protein